MDQQPTQNIQPEIQPQKPMNKTWQIMALTVAGVLVVGGVAAGSYYLWQKSSNNSNQTACTMDAKQCADGSYVSRTGPNCEFAPCPSEALCEGGACPSVNPSPSASTVADETAGWQTYKNDKYGYELRYPFPPGFQPYNSIQDHKFFLDNNVNSIRTNYSHGIGFCEADDAQYDCVDGPTYLILAKPFEYKSLEDMFKTQKDADGSAWIKDYSNEVKSIVIGGVQGLSAPTYTHIGGGISKYIIRNGYLYEFIDGGSEGKFRDKFNQILSTFKFTR